MILGAVSTQELKLMFRSLGQEISDQELKELVDEVDKDGYLTF